MQRITLLTTAVAVVALTTTGTAATAAAGPHVVPRATLAEGLISPLTAAITHHGTAYVSENFAGLLVKKAPHKKTKVIYQAEKHTEVGAVSVRHGIVTFALTGQKQTVNRMSRSGKVSTVADIGAFEKSDNPDAGVVYGFREITDDCAAQVPKKFGPAKYPGTVDSHPYGTAYAGGVTYLADAGANAVLAIDHGVVSTLAVLPAVPVTITAEAAQELGMPDCVAGLDYWFEPVPTDVERGPGGNLYVSTLTGGPEDGSLGALSRVYRVHRGTGDVTQVADGLAGAVGVAVSPDGDVYVSELFGGRIAKVAAGTSTPTTFQHVGLPGAVEYTPAGLYATTNVLSDPPAGKLVRYGF